jgi:hypothetical protein
VARRDIGKGHEPCLLERCSSDQHVVSVRERVGYLLTKSDLLLDHSERMPCRGGELRGGSLHQFTAKGTLVNAMQTTVAAGSDGACRSMFAS